MPIINFLHTFTPSPILFSLGPVHIYWYGFFIVLGTLAALTVALYLAKFYGIKVDIIIDLAFWLIIAGLIGARLYDVGLEWSYFSSHPLDIIKIWRGGIAIHGALIGGLIALWLFAKKYKQSFWQLAAIIVTGLPLAQAIGRWGNYFNQELFGYPTNLPWGIPIDLANRPWQYLDWQYFQPTFLYESIGNLLIFIILILLQVWFIKKRTLRVLSHELLVVSYAMLYSLLRFSTEFIRIEATPIALGLRWPQVVSLLIVAVCIVYLMLKFSKRHKPAASS